jgi:hypothetical protein
MMATLANLHFLQERVAHMKSTGSAPSALPWQFGPIRAKACACNSAMCQRLHQRVTEDLSRRNFLGGVAAMLAPFALPTTAVAATAQADEQRPLLLTNLRLFEGSGKAVREGVQVLVRGQRIADLLPASAQVEGAHVLNCQGKLVMPGLIDVHWHTMLAGVCAQARHRRGAGGRAAHLPQRGNDFADLWPW